MQTRLLLIVPRYLTYGLDGHYIMPIGILAVSAFLKRETNISIYTLNLNHQAGKEKDILQHYIETYKINMIGIGGLSGEYKDLRRIASIVHAIDPTIYIVVGGGIMTADPESTMMAMPEVHFGVIGEGEITMKELVEQVFTSSSYAGIDGLIYRENGGQLIRTKRRAEIQDLDSLPFPDYEGFQYSEYLELNPDLSDPGKKFSQVAVIGGRSCKYNCTFCFHPSGSTYRQRSLDSIFSEIDYLTSHYNVSYVALREELFATDNDRVREFCKRVRMYDFDWSIQLRIDNVNDELLQLLQGSRCRYIFLGIESASNEILKSMHKGITIEQIEQACSLLDHYGLTFRSGVILGDYNETFETAMTTLNWYEQNRIKYRLYADMIIAFPGSVIYKRACRDGIIPNPVTFLQDGCPIINITRMNDEQFDLILHRVSKISNQMYNVKHYIHR